MLSYIKLFNYFITQNNTSLHCLLLFTINKAILLNKKYNIVELINLL